MLYRPKHIPANSILDLFSAIPAALIVVIFVALLALPMGSVVSKQISTETLTETSTATSIIAPTSTTTSTSTPTPTFTRTLTLSPTISSTPTITATRTPTISSTPTITAIPPILVVNKLADTNDGVCSVSDCSLREAVLTAPDGAVINFAAGLTGIIILGDQITINQNITINGPGATILTISGNNSSRIFYINTHIFVHINGLTFINGVSKNYPSLGGAIYDTGYDLTITDCIFHDDKASDVGGAIASDGGFLSIIESVFYNNSSNNYGGAIYSHANTGIIKNNTFYNNSSNRSGGAIAIISLSGYSIPFPISNNTFNDNKAVGGGAIYAFTDFTGGAWPLAVNDTIVGNQGGVFGVTLQNSIIAYNTGWNCDTVRDGGHNLQYPGNGCGAAIPILDPKVSPLQDNGGSTQTMALQPGSPAIDTGDSAICAAAPVNNLDQRGVARPIDGGSGLGSICDIGAYEAPAGTSLNPTFTPTSTITPSQTPTIAATSTSTLTPSRTPTRTPTKTRTPIGTVTPPASANDTIGVFRPSSATFYLRNTNTTGPADITTTLGLSSDLPIVGDWNGDGIDTVGVYRSSTGQFFLRDSNVPGAPIVYTFTLGAPGDLPMAGDWNGSGKGGVGVFRPTNGLIYLKNNLTTGFADYQMVLGIPGDRPVAGDWDGNGIDSPGVFRPSNTTFYLTNQVCNCSPIANFQATLGISGDSPFAGDWDGDGASGIGVFRPTNGLIYLKNVPITGFADLSFTFGIANDKPLGGHWTSAGLIPKPTPANAPTFVP
ncbi:MAG: choice-of-anchor Q domain-containing protein [Chloroflexota bacterium]